MIVYLDTSAVVPILIAEDSSDECRDLWDAADRRASVRLTYVETAAALAMAERQKRLTHAEHDQAWAHFIDIWHDVDVVELTEGVTVLAARLARTLGLRGDDAAHCAAGVFLDDPELVAAAGDAELLRAWRSLGISVFDTQQRPA